MSIEGNMHGYILKALEILRAAEAMAEKEWEYEIKDLDTSEAQLYKYIANARLLLTAIEDLDEKEIRLLKELAQQEHQEGEEIHEILSENYN